MALPDQIPARPPGGRAAAAVRPHGCASAPRSLEAPRPRLRRGGSGPREMAEDNAGRPVSTPASRRIRHRLGPENWSSCSGSGSSARSRAAGSDVPAVHVPALAASPPHPAVGAGSPALEALLRREPFLRILAQKLARRGFAGQRTLLALEALLRRDPFLWILVQKLARRVFAGQRTLLLWLHGVGIGGDDVGYREGGGRVAFGRS